MPKKYTKEHQLEQLEHLKIETEVLRIAARSLLEQMGPLDKSKGLMSMILLDELAPILAQVKFIPRVMTLCSIMDGEMRMLQSHLDQITEEIKTGKLDLDDVSKDEEENNKEEGE